MLDNGQITPGQTVPFPDTGVRALPDELVDRMFHPRLASSRRRSASPPPTTSLSRRSASYADAAAN
jgi:hypothetical protein